MADDNGNGNGGSPPPNPPPGPGFAEGTFEEEVISRLEALRVWVNEILSKLDDDDD